MLRRRWQYSDQGKRDLRIDWLRGLAMTCVIVNHSRITSAFSWFSYERFWLVTAAEVFVVLSGVVLGGVYGRRLVRDGWLAVTRGLARRAMLLYAAFIGVTLSIVALSRAGVDVGSVVMPYDQPDPLRWIVESPALTLSAWRDIALMRCGPWVFEIIGLYVWLVVAAAPCLLALRFIGWRPVLAGSWSVYLWYRFAPHAITTAEFEAAFPILAWQLLFVHGVALGYHRAQVAEFIARRRALLPMLAGAAAVFTALALSNPWTEGPSWLYWSIFSPDRVAHLYFNYFSLADLGVGRLLNLAVALPVGYALLTWCWMLVRPVGAVFVSLGQQSLSAFILHVYGVIAIAHLPGVSDSNVVTTTVVQLLLIVSIAVLLNAAQRIEIRPKRIVTAPRPQPVAA